MWTGHTALAIEHAMTVSEQATFLAFFTKINPHWRGAHVADVLCELYDGDAHLDVVEPLQEQYSALVPEPGLLTMAALAVVYSRGIDGVTWARVHDLIQRTRKELEQ